ncbi:hypothetical protein [Propionivibrio sp.]|uniref:hypothetical protein n=1 Tax=Propionivibrio sp. TaxID=2212460 RepID=UPI003BF2BD9C
MKEIEDKTQDDGEIGAGVFHASPHLVIIEGDVKAPMDTMASRQGELHPQPLTERNVNLSIHSTPIKQTIQPSLAANVRRDTTVFPTNAQETC